MVGDAQITVGDLTSFLFYAVYIGVSMSGKYFRVWWVLDKQDISLLTTAEQKRSKLPFTQPT